jgi:sortase A
MKFRSPALRPAAPGTRLWRTLERACLWGGLALTVACVAHAAQNHRAQQAAIADFVSGTTGTRSMALEQAVARLPAADTRLWSAARIESHRSAQQQPAADVVGILHSASISLNVPVYASASELDLDLGSGVIDGMAYPHEPGHVGIAGHRDGYFRALKDIQPGDTLELETLTGRRTYVVDRTEIVAADDHAALRERDHDLLTLVTCYPFYFVGPAPQRFLVRATPVPAISRITTTTPENSP